MNELLSEIRKSVDSGRITMSELARQSGVSRAYVYRILDGDHVPSLAVAERLAAAIGKKFQLSRLTSCR